MCDPITSTVGVTAIGAGISSIDKTRRDANKAARAQEDAARAALEQQQKQTVDQARASTERQQLLRRGVMSTFTRYPTASTAAPNLAGKASTLGGR
jgi:multidrug resistance efflux pump